MALSLLAACGGGGGSDKEPTPLVELEAIDEDFVNFGTMEGFTYSTDWSIIEKVQIPADADTSVGGWHFFRGSAWNDVEGDIAIQFTYGSPTGVYAWVEKGGWVPVRKDVTLTKGEWYTVCLQYDYASMTLELYVDGSAGYVSTTVTPMDDQTNTNLLYWGGQENHANTATYGDLYSEVDVTFAHQAWFQRLLTAPEIDAYDGTVNDSDPYLFFSPQITDSAVNDASGNGHDGTNGNTPVYYSE
ncbi:MAG: hypothetical protein P1S46_07685 [bacterium]|nr:hypothetical protein [bacterium]MDT8396256.1 LamG-like jellyroll fold domain-containing protein [bacterium]